MATLNLGPFAATTPLLIALCGGGRGTSKARVWEQLLRLERCGKIYRVTTKDRRRGVRWLSCKWASKIADKTYTVVASRTIPSRDIPTAVAEQWVFKKDPDASRPEFFVLNPS